ncbi:MAG TPA: DUF503 domain-containing protein [Acidobacteriota bacterium]
MTVGLCLLDFYLPDCHSIKDKRMVMRSVKDRARARFNLSVSELDHQDLHQRALLGFAMVAGGRVPIERDFHALIRDIELRHPELQVSARIDFLI